MLLCAKLFPFSSVSRSNHIFLVSSRCPHLSLLYSTLFHCPSIHLSKKRHSLHEEWCWPSCSSCHLLVMTSFADNSQVTDQKKKERLELWNSKHDLSPNRQRSEANQNSLKVQYRSYLCFIFPSLFSACPAPLGHFFLPSPMSLSVQWIICLLLANVTPLLTGLTGSQSHTIQHCSWTWLFKILLKFLSYFL